MPPDDERRPAHQSEAPHGDPGQEVRDTSLAPSWRSGARGVAGFSAEQVRLYLRLLGYRVVPCTMFDGESCVTCGPDADRWLNALSEEFAVAERGFRW